MEEPGSRQDVTVGFDFGSNSTSMLWPLHVPKGALPFICSGTEKTEKLRSAISMDRCRCDL